MREKTDRDPRVDARPSSPDTPGTPDDFARQDTPVARIQSGPGTESKDDSSSLFQAIRDTILHALSQHDRLLVVLWYVERMSIREIGEVLDLTDQQVRRTHERVVARLREVTVPVSV